MKTIKAITLFLLFNTLLTSATLLVAKPVSLNKEPSVLENIEQRIDDAFEYFRKTHSTDSLHKIVQQLETANDSKKQRAITYWGAYAKYVLSICHTTQGEAEKAKEYNDQAIAILEPIGEKNSEELTILAQSISYGISFISPALAASASAKARKHLKEALALDNKNIRAYYALGKSDYYTPVEYGGGTIVEENLLKAISLPEESSKTPYGSHSPTWGKKQSYALLAMYYLRQEENSNAKLYYQQGIRKYPDYYALEEVGNRLGMN